MAVILSLTKTVWPPQGVRRNNFATYPDREALSAYSPMTINAHMDDTADGHFSGWGAALPWQPPSAALDGCKWQYCDAYSFLSIILTYFSQNMIGSQLKDTFP